MDELELARELTPEIPVETDYWLVRTDGGALFDPFVKNGCISTGYPKITLKMITDASDTSYATTRGAVLSGLGTTRSCSVAADEVYVLN